MKRNKFLGLGVLVALTMFVLPIVAAATTLNTPLENTNHTATVNFNCTTAINASTTDYNVSITYDEAGGAATTILATITNSSAAQNEFVNAVVDISALTDAVTYNISCYADNGTDQEYSVGAEGITFDSTNPLVTLTVALDGESESFGRGLDYKCGTSDVIDSSITSTFSVAHPSGDSPTSTTLLVNDVTKAFTDTDFSGDYVFTCVGTDYTGNSLTKTATVTVDDMGRLIISGTSGNGVSTSILQDNKFVWIIGAGLLIWFFARKKK